MTDWTHEDAQKRSLFDGTVKFWQEQPSYVLFPGCLSEPMSRLAYSDQPIGFHSAGQQVEVPGVSCYPISDIVVSGSGLLWIDGRIVTQDDLMPRYWQGLIDHPPYSNPSFDSDLPIRDVEETCISALGWGNFVYGHFVIEALPRLLVGKRYCEGNGLSFKVLVRADSPGWLLTNIQTALNLDPGDLVRFDPKVERVRLRNGVIPSYSYLGGAFHPVTNMLVEGLSRRSRGGGVVYISRSRLGASERYARECLNESDIERAMEGEFGATIVHPQSLTWAEQIATFSEAAVLVGLYGSALHTSLFCGSEQGVASIGYLNPVQSHIAGLRSQSMGYQIAGTGRGKFTADVTAITKMVANLIT